jgi:hypothetical protein
LFAVLNRYQRKAFRLLVPSYGMVFEEIQQRLDQDLEEYKDDEEREHEEKKHHLYQLKQQLEQYLQELYMVGFNTGKYDVNAMKLDFFYSIDGQSQDQLYRETEQQFLVYEDIPGQTERQPAAISRSIFQHLEE